MKLAPGLYEQLITIGVENAVTASNDTDVERELLNQEAAPHILARYLHDSLIRALRNLPEEERLSHQVSLANRVLQLLGEAAPNAGIDEEETVRVPAELLLALRQQGDKRLGTGHVTRPSLPLRQSDLLVNGPRDLRVGSEIRRELDSADAVDIIVSFVKFNGVRTLRPELAKFLQRSPGKLRLLTTTYMGATEPEAIEELQQMGAEIRISYDSSKKTRSTTRRRLSMRTA